MKVCENEKFREEKQYTSSSLVVKIKEIRDVFCDTKGKHYINKCEISSDANSRYEMIKKYEPLFQLFGFKS